MRGGGIDQNEVTETSTEPTNSGSWTDSGNYDTSFAGSGTEGDPYLISTPQELARLSYLANSGDTSIRTSYFRQTADLDMSEHIWVPISSTFCGYYDGGNFIISGLQTQASESNQGLFGYIQQGTIKNVVVINSNILGDQNVGGIVGQIFRGSGDVTISNCYFEGKVSGNYNVGGIVGQNYACTIENCCNFGNITGGSRVGGILGYVNFNSSKITNCYNKGNVSGANYVAGICGYLISSDVKNCFNRGNINASGNCVAGIVASTANGYGPSGIYSSYNTGIVQGGGDNIGGIIGYADKYAGISNAYTNVLCCFNIGAVKSLSSSASNIGGVIGQNNSGNPLHAAIWANYWGGDCQTTYGIGNLSSNQDASYLSTIALDSKTESWYNPSNWNGSSSWDFENVWAISQYVNDGYPYLIEAKNLFPDNTDLFWTDDEVTKDTSFAGSGTENDPYLISSEEELAGLAYNVNFGGNNYSGAYFKQTADIDVSAYWWDPIGGGEYDADAESYISLDGFCGNYDGNNNTISGIFTLGEENFQGLFGCVIGSSTSNRVVIENIVVSNSIIHGTALSSAICGLVKYGELLNLKTEASVRLVEVGEFSGIIAGQIEESILRNSVNYGEITATSGTTGAVVGRNYNSSLVADCVNYGTMFGTSNCAGIAGRCEENSITKNSINYGEVKANNVVGGGVVGANMFDSLVTNCINYGRVTGLHYIGGVVGETEYSTVSYCKNFGTVTVLEAHFDGTGGIVGTTDVNTPGATSYILYCENYGEVKSDTDEAGNIGGILGNAEKNIQIANCANFVEISGQGNVSGILGGLSTIANAYITKCYNVGNITSVADNAGGIGGHFAGNSFIKDCYNTGNITTGTVNIGGILGTNIGSCEIINCYNTGEVNGSASVGGILGVVGEKNINTKVINCFNVGEVIYSGDQSGAIIGRVSNSSYSFSNNYYGGNCTLNYGIGTTMNDNGTSRDSNLVANAKSLDWYKDFSNWNGSSPWDFNSVWTLTSSQNDGYPILKNRNSIYVVYHFYGNNQVPLLVTSDNALVENGKLWNGDSSLIYSSIVSGEIELNFSVSNGEQNYRISINEEPTLESDLNSCTYVWNVQDDLILNVYVYQQKTIRYHSNNGTEETVEEFVIGTQNSVVSENLFTAMEGYHFSHWNTLENGNGTNYSVGQEVNFVSNLDLYAQWSGNVYSISFMIDGELGSVYYFKYGVGLFANNPGDTPANPLISISPINRQGYTFYGYFTEPNGQGEMVVDENGWIVCSNTLFLEDSSVYAYIVPNVLAQFDEDGQYWYIEMGKMPQTKVTDYLVINALNGDSTLDDNDGVTTSPNGYYFAGTILQAKIYNGNEYCYYYGSWYLVEPVKWRLDTPSATSGYVSEDTLAVMTNIVYVGRYANHSLGLGEGYATVNDGTSYSFVADYLNNFSAVDKEHLVEFNNNVENFAVSNDSYSTISSSIFLSSNEELNNIFGSYNAEFSDLVKDYLKFNNINSMYFVRDLGSNLNNILCHTESGSTINQRPTNYLGMRFTIKVTEFVCI